MQPLIGLLFYVIVCAVPGFLLGRCCGRRGVLWAGGLCLAAAIGGFVLLPRSYGVWFPNSDVHAGEAVAVVIAVMGATFSLGAFLGARSHRERREAGQCRNFGYDLTGNVTGVCSECGGVV